MSQRTKKYIAAALLWLAVAPLAALFLPGLVLIALVVVGCVFAWRLWRWIELHTAYDGDEAQREKDAWHGDL